MSQTSYRLCFRNKEVMKKLFLFSLIILALSCGNDYVAEEGLNIDNNFSFDVDKNKLFSIGFDTVGIQDCGAYYVLENDIIICKDSLKKMMPTRGYYCDLFTANYSAITVGVDGSTISYNSSWVPALQQALNIYKHYTGLKLSYTQVSPDIVVVKEAMTSSSGLYVGGRGTFPSIQGGYGNVIRINSLSYSGQSLDYYMSHSQKVFLLMHEIGHNLGLRHSNCMVNGEEVSSYGANLVPGTTTNDTDSYMKSNTLFRYWTSMAQCDSIVLRYLWRPKPIIHFENCNINDVAFTEVPYYVSRFLIPTKPGYEFAGWHHSGSAYTPYLYSLGITDDKTLYAHWRTPTTKVRRAFVISNHYHDFTVQVPYVATLEATINKAMNTWEELSSKDGNLSILYKKNNDDSYTEICRIDFRDYILGPYPQGNTITTSLDIVLDPGDYRMESSITTELGPQTEESFGKQGTVTSSIYW